VLLGEDLTMYLKKAGGRVTSAIVVLPVHLELAVRVSWRLGRAAAQRDHGIADSAMISSRRISACGRRGLGLPVRRRRRSRRH